MALRRLRADLPPVTGKPTGRLSSEIDVEKCPTSSCYLAASLGFASLASSLAVAHKAAPAQSEWRKLSVRLSG